MRLYFVATLLATLPVLAGGFYLNLKPAAVTDDVRAKGAGMVAMLSGCHDASKGTLTATAEGVVDGKRKVLPLKVVSLDKPGWFAVQRQWPETGNWVVVLSGRHPAFAVATMAAVPVTGGAVQFEKAKWENRRALSAAEVDALLKER